MFRSELSWTNFNVPDAPSFLEQLGLRGIEAGEEEARVSDMELLSEVSFNHPLPAVITSGFLTASRPRLEAHRFAHSGVSCTRVWVAHTKVGTHPRYPSKGVLYST
jgi:hypothetical protein